MSADGCLKCWECPCCCGYDYKDFSTEERIYYASVALGISAESIYERMADIIPVIHPMNIEGAIIDGESFIANLIKNFEETVRLLKEVNNIKGEDNGP